MEDTRPHEDSVSYDEVVSERVVSGSNSRNRPCPI